MTPTVVNSAVLAIIASVTQIAVVRKDYIEKGLINCIALLSVSEDCFASTNEAEIPDLTLNDNFTYIESANIEECMQMVNMDPVYIRKISFKILALTSLRKEYKLFSPFPYMYIFYFTISNAKYLALIKLFGNMYKFVHIQLMRKVREIT